MILIASNIFIFTLIFTNCNGAEYMKDKASYIKTCKIHEPGFVPCSTESIQTIFDKLINEGIDGLEGINSIDPLKLKQITIFQGDGPVSVNSSISNVVVTGFGNLVIAESNVSPKDYSWLTRIKLPKMRIEGHYNMQGRILVIPLNGHGNCWFEPKDLDIILKTETKLYEKYGHVFYNVTDTKVDFTLSGLKLRLDNLFDGVKVLEDSTNAYLNENWKPVAEALKPIIAKTIEDILLEMLSKVFHFLPADFLISDIAKPSELYGS